MSDSIDFDLKIAEFKINGYVVFEDIIPEKTIDGIREAFMPLLENVRERETELSPVESGDVRTGLGKHQLPNRFTVTIPWVPPFADPAIYEHPLILQFLDRYWESDKYEITCYHSNTPCPGTEYQHWHRDTTMGRDIPHLSLNVCPVVGVKFPLVDISEEKDVTVRMTLTSPGCPVAEQMPGMVQHAVRTFVQDVREVDVEIVWDPPWTPDLMSEAAQLELGFI